MWVNCLSFDYVFVNAVAMVMPAPNQMLANKVNVSAPPPDATTTIRAPMTAATFSLAARTHSTPHRAPTIMTARSRTLAKTEAAPAPL